MAIPLPFLNFFNLLKYGVISQILYFITIPIILKKYSAENYGIFTIAFSVSAIIGAVSALRVERAIVVETINKLGSVLFHCFFYIITLSTVCCAFVFFMLEPFNVDSADRIFMSVLGGTYCFLFGLVQVFTHMAIREGKVQLTGVSDVIYSGLLAVLILIVETDFCPEETVLLIIFIVSRFISLLPYKYLNIFTYFTMDDRESVGFRYLYRYYIPVATTVLSNVQFRGIYYLAGIHYGGAVTGSLSMAQRVVYAPVSLVGASMRKAFFLEFTRSKKDFEVVNGYINKVLKYGSMVSILLFPVFIFVVDKAPKYIAEDWSLVPSFGLALYPVASILVLLSWLDRIYDATNKQPLALMYEVIYTIVLYTVLIIALFFNVSSVDLILFFSVITVFYNLTWAFLTLKSIRSSVNSLLLVAISHIFMLAIIILCLRFNFLPRI